MLTAPERATLVMAAVLTAAGVDFTDDYLAARTVRSRGIRVDAVNRSHYRDHVAHLVDTGHLAADQSVRMGGYTTIVITAAGIAAIQDQEPAA